MLTIIGTGFGNSGTGNGPAQSGGTGKKIIDWVQTYSSRGEVKLVVPFEKNIFKFGSL